jgi:hypothetical protein
MSKTTRESMVSLDARIAEALREDPDTRRRRLREQERRKRRHRRHASVTSWASRAQESGNKADESLMQDATLAPELAGVIPLHGWAAATGDLISRSR